eukprot:4957248-Prorocentrum_lima.AAC.1
MASLLQRQQLAMRTSLQTEAKPRVERAQTGGQGKPKRGPRELMSLPLTSGLDTSGTSSTRQ